jgi:transcriptional regulator with XRE-family HTH domain
MTKEQRTIGKKIKHWRSLKGMSQMTLTELADTSNRHLSFIETGRAHPSEEMV